MRLLDYDGLAEKGVKFSDTHLFRLIRAGEFPRPVKIGNRNHWIEAEVDRFISEKLAQRDASIAA